MYFDRFEYIRGDMNYILVMNIHIHNIQFGGLNGLRLILYIHIFQLFKQLNNIF